jgi:hypothetical protein
MSSSFVRETFVSVALILASAGGSSAQYGVPLGQTDPRLEPIKVRELVASYCRFDYAGARLNPSDWPKVQPLVAWRADPDYPLYMVTSRFDVEAEPVLVHGKYQVTVHYRLLGKFDLTEGYSQDSANQIEDVGYVVSETNGDWRITEANPTYPHPSRAVALQWLNKKLADEKDAAMKTIYQHAIEQLQSQKSPSPLAR